MSEILDYSVKNSFEVYESAVRSEMLEFIPDSAEKILDVGCSVGNFGHLLKSERKVEVWGVEIDQQASEKAAEKLDKVLCGEFGSELDLPKDYFDCVVFNDVLEHMIDPYTALVFTKQLLKKNGMIIASIPNVRYFDNMWNLIVHCRWDYVDSGILDRTHLRFFTKKSILSTFTNLGYEIETLAGINSLEKYDAYYMRKFNFLNFLSFRKIEDMRWMQFAVVAKPSRKLE